MSKLRSLNISTKQDTSQLLLKFTSSHEVLDMARELKAIGIDKFEVNTRACELYLNTQISGEKIEFRYEGRAADIVILLGLQDEHFCALSIGKSMVFLKWDSNLSLDLTHSAFSSSSPALSLESEYIKTEVKTCFENYIAAKKKCAAKISKWSRITDGGLLPTKINQFKSEILNTTLSIYQQKLADFHKFLLDCDKQNPDIVSEIESATVNVGVILDKKNISEVEVDESSSAAAGAASSPLIIRHSAPVAQLCKQDIIGELKKLTGVSCVGTEENIYEGNRNLWFKFNTSEDAQVVSEFLLANNIGKLNQRTGKLVAKASVRSLCSDGEAYNVIIMTPENMHDAVQLVQTLSIKNDPAIAHEDADSSPVVAAAALEDILQPNRRAQLKAQFKIWTNKEILSTVIQKVGILTDKLNICWNTYKASTDIWVEFASYDEGVKFSNFLASNGIVRAGTLAEPKYVEDMDGPHHNVLIMSPANMNSLLPLVGGGELTAPDMDGSIVHHDNLF